jgi:hypothetical protein
MSNNYGGGRGNQESPINVPGKLDYMPPQQPYYAQPPMPMAPPQMPPQYYEQPMPYAQQPP